MTKEIVVTYFSGYGHTKHIAEIIANEINAHLIAISSEGTIADNEWELLNKAKTIIFGSPTYMAGVPWQFKKFADASSKIWAMQGWKNKLFAGFSNGASINGRKEFTLDYLQHFAAQHGGIWISLGILPASNLNSTRSDINHLGGSSGLLVQSPADAGADKIPQGDLDTAKAFAHRVKEITGKYQY